MKVIKGLLGHRIAVEIDERRWMGIAREELANLERARRKHRTEDQDIAEALVEEHGSSEDEGTHQDRAQIRVGLDEGEQPVSRHLDHLAWRRRANGGERPASSEHVELAAERARVIRRDELLTVARCTHDGELSIRDDEERVLLLARIEDHLAGLQRAKTALFRDTRDLRGRQRGPELIVTRRNREGNCGCHRSSAFSGPLPSQPRRTVQVLLAFTISFPRRRSKPYRTSSSSLASRGR